MISLRFGCHLSIREGYIGAAKSADKIGAACFQYFPKNPRSLSVKNFNKEEAHECKEFCREHDIISVAHTPYPTNLTPPENKKDIILQSLKNDLEIAEACGSLGVVVHFGSSISKTDPLAGYQLMIAMLNAVLDNWEGKTKILIENNAGKPGSLGTTIEELVMVRSLCNSPEKIGFCLDTCHAFASGLWATESTKEFLEKGSEKGYFQELKAIHFNNSKYPANSGVDRHANIFSGGYIKEEEFTELLNASVIGNLPLILETPSDEGITHEHEVNCLKQKWG